MSTRILKTVKNTKFMRRFPPTTIGSLVVAVICAFLLVIFTFTPIALLIPAIPQAALTNPHAFFANVNSLSQITDIFYYIPQIPVVLMIAAILGPRLGILSVLIYISAGLAGFPVFANGGGINYYSQHGFGYILGFLAGAYTCGNILSYKQKPYMLFRAAIVGVTAVHLIGIIYLTGVLFVKRASILTALGWIWQYSGVQYFYDLLFAIVAILIGRFLRKLLWLAMD